MAEGNTTIAIWRGDGGPPGSETRSCAQGNHGNLRSPANCSLKVTGGLARRGKTGGGKLGRQDGGSRRSTADGDEGNESTGGRASTGEEPGRETGGPNTGSDLSSRSSHPGERRGQTVAPDPVHGAAAPHRRRGARTSVPAAAAEGGARGGRDDGGNLRREARGEFPPRLRQG